MSKVHVLYIEDDPEQRGALEKSLRKRGLSVTASGSGKDGIRLFKESSPDLVLCDLNMPVMSGLEVLKKIKQLDDDVPVVLLTAHGSVNQAVKALKYGAHDFLLKPLEINRIITTINNALEKRYLQKEVQRSEGNLQMLMETVPDVVYSLNDKGEFLRINQAVEHLLGYKPAEMLGTSVFDYIYPEDRKQTEAGFRKAVESRDTKVQQIQFRMMTKSGEVKHFEVNRRMVFDNSRAVRQDGIAREISQRKELRQELRKYSEELKLLVEERTAKLEYATRQLAALNAVSNRFTQIYDENELLEEVTVLLTDSLDFDRATLLLKEDGKLALRSYCMEKDTPELVENFLKQVRSEDYVMPPHFYESFEQNQTIFIPDLNADPRWPRDEGREIRTKAVVISPIKINKKPIGVIVGNMQHHDREMDAQDVARFEMFANIVGLALENIRAYKSLEKQVIERTKSLRDANRKLRSKARELEKSTYSLGRANVDLLSVQEELEKKNNEMQDLLSDISESEERFRQLTETINEVFWMVDLASGQTLYVNPAYETIYNRPVKSLYENAKDWVDALHPDDRDRILEEMEDDVENPVEHEFRIIRPDGSVRWIRTRPFPVKNSKGHVYRLCGISEDITERKQVTEALERERNFVSAILETAGALVIVIDPQGRIVRFNRACEETTGYTFDEIKGKKFWDIFLLPEEIAQVRSVFVELCNGGFPYFYENIWLTKKGKRRIIAWSNTAITDSKGVVEHVIGTGIDITDRKEAEKNLRLYKEIFINSQDPINILDREGKLIQQNPAFRDLIGYNEKDLMGKTPAVFIGEEGFAEIGKALQEKGSYRGEIVSYPKTGEPIDVELSAFTMKDENGDIAYNIGFARDITKRKQAENALQKSLAELAEANNHLKQTQGQLVQSEKMASLGMLVAGIAHEINTPIGAVSSMHDTLKRAVSKLRHTLETEYAKELEQNKGLSRPVAIIEEANRVIDSGTERVTNIVRRLRSFARLDEAELKTVDIHEGLEDTLTLIHHEIKHHITVEKHYGDLPPVPCFPGRLNQVFLNILINAKQAIKDKGTITVTTYQKDNKVFIEISDTGVGIPPEKLDKVFDPGFTTKGVGIGTGLGLSIVYQIIEDHKGNIKVESEVGKGSKFTIILPMDLDEQLHYT